MNKYRDKSDFEINKAAAIEMFGLNRVIEKGDSIYIDECDCGAMFSFDPCNNPADAMPIIIENKISLRAPTITDRWKAEFVDEYGNYVGYIRALNKNPLRAVMEVFLMMKDAENEK
ncbi:TPA: phage protein NinX family protein [Morganella morganii]|uniref:phage protein NinX family protein n=1 Tax=Morganella morganii TaxID=582 RepID=UPI000F83C9FA|nr:phage protein NinX family protein [Morganella morganii]RTY32682.1 DUF2591 domain-containing protein [Morganella morganii subsp. morganii]HEI8863159.1 DUF2591 family protein [Morganella morganii]